MDGSRQWAWSPVPHLQLLIGLAVLLGGGGVAYGIHNLVVQLAALAMLGFHAGAVLHFVRSRGAVFWLLVATLAVPLLQLVPLPPTLWQSLPGRELVVESYAVAGIDPASWRPISLDTGRTLVAFCGLLAASTIVILGAGLSRAEIARLGWTLVALAMAALLLGAVQLASGNTAAMLYPIEPLPDVLYGVFANRNSAGLLFALVLVLLVVLPSRGDWPPEWPFRLGAGSLLALGVVLTQSRSAMAILLVILGFAAVRFALDRRSGMRFPRWSVLLAAAVALAAAAMLALGNARVGASLARFTTLEGDRLEMWEDAWFAAQAYWPLGSGMGTFDEVFQLHESLEHVSVKTAGRAHNDYIELALEGGLMVLVLAASWAVWIGFSALRSGHDLWLRHGAGLALLCIALQSLLDYPMRNQALLCVAALFVVMLLPRQEAER